jgi:hypothetical protein
MTLSVAKFHPTTITRELPKRSSDQPNMHILLRFQWHGWSAGRLPVWTVVKNQSIGLIDYAQIELVVAQFAHGVSTIA